jgi:hypothetical protein
MLTAIDREDGRKICSLDYADVRVGYPGWRNLVCPISGKPVFPRREHFRSGVFVRSHFASTAVLDSDWPDDLMFDCEYAAHRSGGGLSFGESIYHVAGKEFVRNAASQMDSILTPELAVFEHQVKLSTGKRRIIDVAFVFPSGLILAQEVQLAAITPRDLEDRSEDYRSAGIDVTWWLGKKAATESNFEWHKQHLGYYPPILEFDERDDTSILQVEGE